MAKRIPRHVSSSHRVVSDGARGTKMVQNDTLENLVSGMGTRSDKSTHTLWVDNQLNRQQLEIAYANDWIARKVIDIPAADSTREWRKWQAEDDDIAAIEGTEQHLKVKLKVKNGLIRSRLFGGAALVMGVKQGNPQDELNIEAVGEGDLEFLHVVSRYELVPQDLNRDPLSPYYGQPKFYQVNSSTTNMTIHPSRVVRLIGLEPPDPFTSLASAQNLGWGDSVLKLLADAIKSAGTVTQSVAGLLQEAQVDIIKVPDLTANMVTADYEANLEKRFALAASLKSIYNMLLLDKEEDWERVETQLSGMPDLLRTYLLIASGAADIPATRFLGQSPAGLSSTGESDMRNYYDRIKSDQSTVLSPELEVLDEVLVRSSLGDFPDDVWYEWNSLWQMTPEQKAELDNKKASTFKIDVDTNILPAPVMRDARINQLIEDGVYPGLEGIVDEFEASEESDPDLLNPPNPSNENEPSEKELEQEMADRIRKFDKKRKPWRRPRDYSPGRRGKFAAHKNAARLPKAVQAMLLGDATAPRSLYVYRPVINAKEIIDHFKKQGFTTLTPADELHVTIIYSRAAIDWSKTGTPWGEDEKGNITIKPGSMRMVEQFGEATVLLFNSSELSYRHCDFKSHGCEWDWDDYQPHITLTYEGAPEPVRDIEAYQGRIILGPEKFEEVKDDWKESIVEDAIAETPK